MNRKTLRLISIVIVIIGSCVAVLHLQETDSLIYWLGGCLLFFGLGGFSYSEAFMYLPKERHITSRWYARSIFLTVTLASICSLISLVSVAIYA